MLLFWYSYLKKMLMTRSIKIIECFQYSNSFIICRWCIRKSINLAQKLFRESVESLRKRHECKFDLFSIWQCRSLKISTLSYIKQIWFSIINQLKTILYVYRNFLLLLLLLLKVFAYMECNTCTWVSTFHISLTTKNIYQ